MFPENEGVNGKPMTRRQLLTTLGTAGLVAAAGAVFPGEARAATADSLFYNVKDYGARGTGRSDNNDAPYIQSAIDAAALTGGTVYLPPGKYFIGSSIQLKSNVRLLGAGAEATVIKLNFNAGATNMLSCLSEISFFSIEHLTLEGTGTPTGSVNYFSVERGIFLQNASNGRIANCEFKTVVTGIHLNNSTNVTVSDCIFRFVIGTDGPYEGFGILCQSGGNHLIIGNRFKNVYKPCVQLSSGCSSTIVANNRMEDYRGAAIAVTSQEKACSNNIIADNIITGTDSGTDNASSYGITLSDYCTGNTVTGNIIAKAAKAGIKLEGSASAEKERPFGNRVNGNSVASTASGIVLLNAEDNAITGNDIRGADVGIAIDTSGDGAGAYSRRNYAVYNGLFYCAKTAVKLGSVRCEANGVFGNFGSGNGENVSDQGTGTVTAGF